MVTLSYLLRTLISLLLIIDIIKCGLNNSVILKLFILAYRLNNIQFKTIFYHIFKLLWWIMLRWLMGQLLRGRTVIHRKTWMLFVNWSTALVWLLLRTSRICRLMVIILFLFFLLFFAFCAFHIFQWCNT